MIWPRRDYNGARGELPNTPGRDDGWCPCGEYRVEWGKAHCPICLELPLEERP